MLSDHKHSMFYRRGASAARGAHNSEVTGSTPVAGILHFASFIVLPHNPPASSWGDQKLVVKLDIKRSLLNHSLGAAYRRFLLTL